MAALTAIQISTITIAPTRLLGCERCTLIQESA
jgi:hypothetical protein